MLLTTAIKQENMSVMTPEQMFTAYLEFLTRDLRATVGEWASWFVANPIAQVVAAVVVVAWFRHYGRQRVREAGGEW